MTIPPENPDEGTSKYDPDSVIQHFDEFADHEWDRLVQSPMHEVNLYIHTHYLEKYISRGNKVLEIGAGPGRFTQVLSRLGAHIVVADISNVQLELNKRFAAELGFNESVLDRKQVDICDLSLFGPNSFGLCCGLRRAFTGSTYILLRHFDPGPSMRTIAREMVTHVILAPSQIVALLDSPDFSPDALSSLEMVLSLGAPLRREHKERLSRLLPDRFYELYGLAEGFVTVLDKHDYPRKPTSVGAPPPFFEMRIVDSDGNGLPAGEVGEICGRGPILMSGYYKQPELTRAALRDGWLHSGDIGYVDEDGFLYLVSDS